MASVNLNDLLKTPSPSLWKVRLAATVIMLLLALGGLLITYTTSVDSYISWYAWLIIGVLFALLSIFLAIYFHKKDPSKIGSGVWHEILHWIAFIVILFVLHVYVHTGMVGRFEGGLFILALLSFSVLISGVYLDATFLLVGIVLTIFSLVMSILTKYLALILVFVVLMAAITIAFFISKRKSAANEEVELNKAQKQKTTESNDDSSEK